MRDQSIESSVDHTFPPHPVNLSLSKVTKAPDATETQEHCCSLLF